MMKRGQRDATSSSGHAKSNATGSKKTVECLREQRRPWLEPHHEQIRVRRPCQWLGVNRARWYYQPVDERVEHLHLLRWLDAP